MPPRVEPATSTTAQYVGLFQALLPRGKPWILRTDGRAYLFVTGLMTEAVRVHDWLVGLIDLMDPRYTSGTMLEAWERSLGLPEEGGTIAGSTAQRRLDVAAKIAAAKIRTEADWIALAEAAGYTSVTITQGSDAMATCDSTCDAYVGGPYWDAFTFTINMPGQTSNPAFDALCGRLVQAGVRVFFDYT